MKSMGWWSILALLAAGLSGCATLGQVIKVGGQLSGYQELQAMGDNMVKSDRTFTEEEKYYIGRTVAATLMAEAPWKNNPRLTLYLNEIGNTLALASDQPEMYHGYHFALLDNKNANAYSCPGGFVFLSQGLLNLCRNEDEVAAVFAHELAHVILGHPMEAIQASHQRAAVASLIKFGLRKAGESNADVQQLSGLFDNVVKDVVKAVAQGYSRDKERQADALAVDMLVKAGYAPQALADVLGRMQGHSGYHGDPKLRARAVLAIIRPKGGVTPVDPGRTRRFRAIEATMAAKTGARRQ